MIKDGGLTSYNAWKSAVKLLEMTNKREKYMSETKEILSIISKEGVANLHALSRKLSLSIPTLRAMIESIAHQGYLEEIRCESSCSICPMNCGPLSSKTKIYRLTKKGMKYIKGTSDSNS